VWGEGAEGVWRRPPISWTLLGAMSFELVTCGNVIKVWGPGDHGSLSLLSDFAPHTATIRAVAWNHTGKVIASAADDGRVVLSLPTGDKAGTELCAFPQPPNKPNDELRCVAFGGNSRYLLTGGERKAVKIWDLKRKALAKTLTGHQGAVRCGAFGPDGTVVASGGTTWGELLLYSLLGSTPQRLILDGHSHSADSVNALHFSPHGKNSLAAAYSNGSIATWDTSTHALCSHVQNAHTDAVTAVEFSPRNSLLMCTAGVDGALKLHDSGTAEILQTIDCGEALTSMSFMDDGTTIAVGTVSGDFHIFDLRNVNEPTSTTHAYDGPVHGLAFRQVEGAIARQPPTSSRQDSSPRKQALLNAAAAAIATKHPVSTAKATTESRNASPLPMSPTPRAAAPPAEVPSSMSTPRSAASAIMPPRVNARERLSEQPVFVDEMKRGGLASRRAEEANHSEPVEAFDHSAATPISSVDAGPSATIVPQVPGADAIRCMIDESFERMQYKLHRDVQSMHVEMIRQFEIQKNELSAHVDRLSVVEDLMREIKALREENQKLRERY